jgi:hypothetical protein
MLSVFGNQLASAPTALLLQDGAFVCRAAPAPALRELP